jgi:ABC-type multidrug transport system ATPase subunit/glycosyltransferase involved in cell wall biosynthesis
VADVPFEIARALADIRHTVESGRVGAALQDLRDLAARCGFQTLSDEVSEFLSRRREHENVRAMDLSRQPDSEFRNYAQGTLNLLARLKKEIVDTPGPLEIRDTSVAPIGQPNDLIVKDLFKEHQKAFRLTGVSFMVRRGQIAGIVGPNGSGKTTLLRILAGDLARDGGDVNFAGAEPGSRQYRANVAFVPQRPPRWKHDVRRHLSWHAALAARRPKESESAVEDVLTWLQLRNHAQRGFDQISEGQRMRVAIAAALLSRPKLLLLDEPLARLDASAQLQFLEWLRLRTREWRDLATVISSQHISEIESVADEIIRLEAGRRVPLAKAETGEAVSFRRQNHPDTLDHSAMSLVAFNDLLQFRDNRDNFNELVAAIRSGVPLRPFVGAGLSVPCGYPGWRAFLVAEARRLGIEQEITSACDAGRFEEAANRIEAELGPNGLHHRVRQVFGNEQAPQGAVLLLPRIANGSIITTNFDPVIESVYLAARRRITPIWGTRLAVLSEALFTQNLYLLKIHGDAADPSDRVLTSDEYNRHYGPDPGPWTTPLPTALGRIFSSSILLFVGCSLLGDRTMRVLEHVIAATPGMPTHYAIVESPSEDAKFRERMRWLNERRIAPIWYPKGKHEAVETLLRAIVDAVGTWVWSSREDAVGWLPMGQTQDLRRLIELLKSLFAADELRRWVHLRFGRGIMDKLPSPGTSLEKIAYELATLLEQHGLIGPALFDALIDERPGRREDIIAVARGAGTPDGRRVELGRSFGEPAAARPDERTPHLTHPVGTSHASLVPASARGWLAVATEWLSRNGGLSTLNRLLCRALAAAGEQVTCLVPAADEAERQAAAADGVRLVIAPPPPGVDPLGGLWRRPILPQGFEPGVIIGHGRITGSAAKVLADDHFPAARRLHLLHMAPDEIEWFKPRPEEGAARRAEQRTLQELALTQGATAVAVGPRLHNRYSIDLHAQGQQLLRLDPGFDVPGTPATVPPGSTMRVLILGRLEDYELKGLDLAARAVAAARHRHPIELWVRGAPDGTGDALRARMREDAGDPGLPVVVRHYTADADALATDLRTASLVLMPSRSEGFGLVGLEGITAGVPVLLSRASGLAQLIEEKLPSEEARLHVIPMSGDGETDVSAWSYGINRTLDDRRASFTRAGELRTKLAASSTWARAASVLIDWAAQPPGNP